MVTIDENHRDELEATLQPVEQGAPVTDHAYRMPAQVVLRMGWSNSGAGLFSLQALSDLSQAVGDLGQQLTGTYVQSVYDQLLTLQQSRQTFTIVTRKRLYTSMLMVSLEANTDASTYNSLMITASCREIITVATSSTTVVAQGNQAIPATTAGSVNQGTAQLKPVAAPSAILQISNLFSG